MSLIDRDYFYGDINLPASKYDSKDDFINKYEKELLIKLFGYTLYKLIAAYDKDNPTASPERIRDIVTGKEFEMDGYTYKWNGLINEEKVSPIAYYVYYYYLKDKQTATTNTGEAKTEKINAINTTSNQKLTQAWSKLKEIIGPFDIGYMISGIPFDMNEYYQSLFFFMYHNFDTYPEWQYSDIGSVNILDL